MHEMSKVRGGGRTSMKTTNQVFRVLSKWYDSESGSWNWDSSRFSIFSYPCLTRS